MNKTKIIWNKMQKKTINKTKKWQMIMMIMKRIQKTIMKIKAMIIIIMMIYKKKRNSNKMITMKKIQIIKKMKIIRMMIILIQKKRPKMFPILSQINKNNRKFRVQLFILKMIISINKLIKMSKKKKNQKIQNPIISKKVEIQLDKKDTLKQYLYFKTH